MKEIGQIINDEIVKQLNSVPAQRLIERLSLIKNRIDPCKKRWFWELLQNASDYNEEVSVKLIVTDDKVEFLHNGSPFSIADVLNVISPDSNKTEDASHKDNIGKFGTGLVSTHILSSEITVNGLCSKDEKLLGRFHLTLDRSCFLNKEELIGVMTSTRDNLENSITEITHAEKGFNTSFSYDLHKTLPTLPRIQADDLKLDYLYDVMPYTLCFMPKVQTVEIEDRRGSNSHTYQISRAESDEEDCKSFLIRRDGNEETLRFAFLSYQSVSTAFQFGDGEVKPFPNDISKIFCGLPLIGTEEIGLPILLNSFGFMPTTEREGVELDPNSNKENVAIIKDSVELYRMALEFVKSHKLGCAYNLSRIRRHYNGTQASNTQFQTIFMKEYVKLLLTYPIIKNARGEFITLNDTRIPLRNSEADDTLYALAQFIASNVIPSPEEYTQWIDKLDFTTFKNQIFNPSTLADAIEQFGCIHTIPGSDSEVVLAWLLKSLSYLKEVDMYIFSKKKLLPNQEGTFLLCNELYADADLPKELKDIHDQLYPSEEKIESVLLNDAFKELNVVNQAYTCQKLAEDIDCKMKDIYSKNGGNASSFYKPLNDLYTWLTKVNSSKYQIDKDDLERWFRWYYPKRASLIVDMLKDDEREQALIIAQSGLMEPLSELAKADITKEELYKLVANSHILAKVLAYMNDKVNDKEFANLEEGDAGEKIVYNDLKKQYPVTKGYKVIWASKDEDEPCYDFRVIKGNSVICYCDAKTTKRGTANADSIPFFMRRSQWDFLQSLDDSTPYFIARVFMGDNGAIKYMRITKKDR